MDDTFKILAEFLDKFGDEVEGRQFSEPAEETKKQLRQLARGELPAAERSALLNQLISHTEWISWLAQEVKSLRTAQG